MSLQTEHRVDVVASDDDIIATNQRLRRQLINDMVVDGKTPTDNKDRVVFLTALNDSDRTALTKKKIGADKDSSDADRQVSLFVARLGFELKSHREMEVPLDSVQPPQLDPTQLPALELLPGETDKHPTSETYDEFMARMDAEHGIGT